MDDNSFFSINRLVEFGMGMAVAQQMVKTMNHAMTDMYVPGVMNPMQAQTQPQSFFYAIIDDLQSGPYSEQELTRLITEKKISNKTYIWKPGLSSWDIAENIPEVLKLVALAPPPFQQNK